MTAPFPHTPTVILLVEDEPLVRMLGTDVLEDAGFLVVEAMDAQDALAQLEAHPEVDILFTDVQMPGELDGVALARIVHDRRPDVRLVIASGRARLEPQDIPDNGRFVPKPYRPDELVGVMREVLA
ncbi:response regulator [Salinarimonas soli]|uniref:Response regulator n=1 Tax=Salinarimonas soli TaxID=1638099 RepID=A0A5B2VH60_9HYPH|nr:response regulator [Salinarimonas soli]KAA2237876.1 response regulator [Salinarimonas soli]